MEKDSVAVIYIIVLIVAGILIGAFGYLVLKMPADATYAKKFGAHVTMAYDQSTFEGMREQIMVVWTEMNKTFAGWDYAHTYSTWWGPDQTYENSLEAQEDYLEQIIRRIDNYIADYERLKTQPGNVILTDWYDKAITGMRAEMKYEGGLDWALNGAWYYNIAPMAYWFNTLLLVVFIVLVVLGILGLIIIYSIS